MLSAVRMRCVIGVGRCHRLVNENPKRCSPTNRPTRSPDRKADPAPPQPTTLPAHRREHAGRMPALVHRPPSGREWRRGDLPDHRWRCGRPPRRHLARSGQPDAAGRARHPARPGRRSAHPARRRRVGRAAEHRGPDRQPDEHDTTCHPTTIKLVRQLLQPTSDRRRTAVVLIDRAARDARSCSPQAAHETSPTRTPPPRSRTDAPRAIKPVSADIHRQPRAHQQECARPRPPRWALLHECGEDRDGRLRSIRCSARTIPPSPAWTTCQTPHMWARTQPSPGIGRALQRHTTSVSWGSSSARVVGPTSVEPMRTGYDDHYNGRLPHRALQLRPPRPDHPALDLERRRIRRRSVRGGLISEYEPAA